MFIVEKMCNMYYATILNKAPVFFSTHPEFDLYEQVNCGCFY